MKLLICFLCSIFATTKNDRPHTVEINPTASYKPMLCRKRHGTSGWRDLRNVAEKGLVKKARNLQTCLDREINGKLAQYGNKTTPAVQKELMEHIKKQSMIVRILGAKQDVENGPPPKYIEALPNEHETLAQLFGKKVMKIVTDFVGKLCNILSWFKKLIKSNWSYEKCFYSIPWLSDFFSDLLVSEDALYCLFYMNSCSTLYFYTIF